MTRDAIQKYDFYWMDDPCAFKPLDFMSALSIALVSDDDQMYTLFARETAKFALSRSDHAHYLWPYLQTVGINSLPQNHHLGMAQNAGGGFASGAEVMQIYRLTGSHSASLPEYAKEHGGFDASARNITSNQEIYDRTFFSELDCLWFAYD